MNPKVRLHNMHQLVVPRKRRGTYVNRLASWVVAIHSTLLECHRRPRSALHISSTSPRRLSSDCRSLCARRRRGELARVRVVVSPSGGRVLFDVGLAGAPKRLDGRLGGSTSGLGGSCFGGAAVPGGLARCCCGSFYRDGGLPRARGWGGRDWDCCRAWCSCRPRGRHGWERGGGKREGGPKEEESRRTWSARKCSKRVFAPSPLLLLPSTQCQSPLRTVVRGNTGDIGHTPPSTT